MRMKKKARHAGRPPGREAGVVSEIEIDDPSFLVDFFGPHEEHLALMEEALQVCIGTRGHRVLIQGEPDGVEKTAKIIRKCEALRKIGKPLDPAELSRVILTLIDEPGAPLEEINNDLILFSPGRKPIAPQSPAQKSYVDAMRRSDIVFSIGPAGTGKTYLAVAMAVAFLTRRQYRRIILTRPAVEAGEKLGYLPGDILEKVNPYLRPLYDALGDMMEIEKSQALIQKGAIEVAPLAFMRGRTLNSSFIILDEAQNTTSAQMKMFLTRLGFDSKAVIAGDITQVDLPPDARSGLVDANERLQGIEGIEFCTFSEKDVVRHPLVQEIIRRYDDRSRRS